MTSSNLSISYHIGTTSSMDWFSWLSRTTLEPSLIYDYGLTFSRNELQLEDACYFNHEFLQSMGISIAKHRLEIIKLVKKEEGAARPKKLSGVIKKCLRKCMDKFVSREDDKKDHAVKHTVASMEPPPLPEINWYQGKLKGSFVRRQQGSEDLKEEKEKPLPVPPVYRSRAIALSGPLDGSRMHHHHHHEKMVHNRALKLSGPLDGRMHERNMNNTVRSPLMPRPLDARFVATTRSPRVSGPLDPRVMLENRSPRLSRPSDAARPETDSPMGYSPYNKPKDDFDFDDDHTLWPSLFQDLKPT